MKKAAIAAGAVLTVAAASVAMMLSPKSPAIALSGGCSIFPADHIWNVPVKDLPPDPKSADYVRSMGPDLPLHPDFGITGGIPYAVAGPAEPIAQVSAAGSESDRGPYRIPDDAPREGGGDSHVLVIDPSRCMLYELFAASRGGPHHWQAGSAAIFDLRSYRLRQSGWTSADAAGLPILPGLVRYDEVKQGAIRHALRFTTRRTRRAFVWPARHLASRAEDPHLPPMGQRFRLRSSFAMQDFSEQARVILTALRDYGMILADNGGPWFVSGAPDSRWNLTLTAEFRKVKGADFEAVDCSGLMADPDSGQVRH